MRHIQNIWTNTAKLLANIQLHTKNVDRLWRHGKPVDNDIYAYIYIYISAETIILLFDYSVGMTLFNSLPHYLNNRWQLCSDGNLKLEVVNEMMYLCYKNAILEKIEIAVRLYLSP